MAVSLHVDCVQLDLINRHKCSTATSSDSGFHNGDTGSNITENGTSPRSAKSEKFWRLPRAAPDVVTPRVYGYTNKKEKKMSTPIINDLDNEPINRQRVSMNRYDIPLEDIAVEDNASLVRSSSYESIVSGVSCGSTASEERLSVLQYVRSLSSLSSKETKSGAGSTISEPAYIKKNYFKNNQDSEDLCRAKAQRSRVEFDDNVSVARGENAVLHQKRSNLQRMVSKNYDSDLEKSHTFLHGQGKHFSKSNQHLSPIRPGLQKLQICYTQTNTENNHLVIFADLIRTSHQKNNIVQDTVYHLERRLRIRRNDPSRATTFYVNKGIKDPIRDSKKKARTIAGKKKERIERIQKTTEELKLGYIPKAQTIRPATREDIERLCTCRYLRIDPKLQGIL